jgi:hypothetical protein
MRRLFFAIVLIGLTPIFVLADMVSFVTPTGSSTSGGPVSAEATFTTTAGSLVITLVDLQANPTDIAQSLSDFEFLLNGNVPLIGSNLSSSSGQEITVNGDGTFSLGSTVPTGWTYGSTPTSGLLDVLLPGGAGPSHLIIGPPGGGSTYSNANGSIAGNKPHNPFLNQTATFTITGAGIRADTTVTAVTFSFGTTEGVNLVPGFPTSTIIPEPRATGIIVSAIGLISLLRYRRKKALSAV